MNEEEDQEEEQGKNENSIKKKKRKVIVTPIVVEENNLDKQLDIASSSLSSSSKKKSKRENSNKPNLNEKSLYKLLKKYRMKKANDSNIDKNNEEETRMFYILHSTVKAFLKKKNQHMREIMWVRKYYEAFLARIRIFYI